MTEAKAGMILDSQLAKKRKQLTKQLAEENRQLADEQRAMYDITINTIIIISIIIKELRTNLSGLTHLNAPDS